MIDVVEQHEQALAGDARAEERGALSQARRNDGVLKAQRAQKLAKHVADADATAVPKLAKVAIELPVAVTAAVLVRPVGTCRALPDAVAAA
jgi:hypothetical protein